MRRSGLFRYGGIDTNQVCRTYQHDASITKYRNQKITNLANKIEGLPVALYISQAAGVLASLLGIVSVFLLFFSLFSKRLLSKCVYRITIPVLTILAGVNQLLTFVIFAVDDCRCTMEQQENNECAVVTCSLLDGGRTSVAAALLYLAMGVGMIFYPKPSTPLCLGMVKKEESQEGGKNTEDV
mmetsp:Transcript_28335/g.41868  ORF Transcript_28335/g.41868 Transcript_28335/m.41868 type:complete len:183 (+) Transcript_28335:1-549(+)